MGVIDYDEVQRRAREGTKGLKTIHGAESFCCEEFMKATSYDQPFFRWATTDQWGIALFRLTALKKAISNAINSREYKVINYCPFCGTCLGEE